MRNNKLTIKNYGITKANDIFSLLSLSIILCASLLLLSCTNTAAQEQKSVEAIQISDNSNLPGDNAETVFLHLALNHAMANGDVAVAEEAAEKLLKIAPSADLYSDRINIRLYLEKYDEARRLAEEGVKLFPADLNLNIFYAQLLAKYSTPEKGIAHLKGFKEYVTKEDLYKTKEEKEKLDFQININLLPLYFAMGDFKESDKIIRQLPDKIKTEEFERTEVQVLLESPSEVKRGQQKLKNLAAKYPNSPQVKVLQAEEAASRKAFKSSASYYLEAAKLNPAPQIIQLAVNALIDGGATEEAISLALGSEIENTYKIQTAILFIEKGMFDEAYTLLNAITPKNNEELNSWLYHKAILAYDSNTHIEEVIGLLEKDLDLVKSGNLLHITTLLYIKSNSPDKALELAEVLLKNNPDEMGNWLLMMELQTDLKRFKEAEKTAREAYKRWPENLGVNLVLANSLLQQDRPKETVKVLDPLLEKDPNNAMIMNFIGYTLADENLDIPRAVALLEKAHKLEPESYEITDSLAWAYYRAGEMEKALKLIEKSLKINENDPVQWDHYGDIAVALGKFEIAKNAYKTALSKSPEDPKEIEAKLSKIVNSNN